MTYNQADGMETKMRSSKSKATEKRAKGSGNISRVSVSGFQESGIGRMDYQ